MSVKARVRRLELVASARGMRQLPILTLTELLDEPGVFTEDPQCYPQRYDERTEAAQRYTEADLPELEKRYRLILVHWVKAWRAAEADHRGTAVAPQR